MKSWRWLNMRYRVKCGTCSWSGYRVARDCECYAEWAMYCRPSSPGPGCPSTVVWNCPNGHKVTAKKAEATE